MALNKILNFIFEEKLSSDQVDTLKAAFSLFDKNRDGNISAAELKQAFAELGQAPTDEEIRLMVFFLFD